MKPLAVLLILFGILFSCAVPMAEAAGGGDAGAFEPCTKTVSIAWHGDTAFTKGERDLIEAGFADVTKFTSGRVTTSVTWDVDFSSTPSVLLAAQGPLLGRSQSWMKPVQAADAEISARYGYQTTVRAWTESNPLRIFFVIDRITQLQQTASHELIHAAGARWPNCDSTNKDCDHVTDGDSIMSRGIRDDVHTFSPSDLTLCRASCLCP